MPERTPYQSRRDSLDTVWNIDDAARSLASISTNATAADLSGAGRCLGHAYDSLGHLLERLLNKFAERKGLGPHAVAARIRERIGKLEAESQEILLLKQRKVKKDAKKLLKYTQSHVENNQRAAFDEVVDLIVGYSGVQALLQKLDGVSRIASAYAHAKRYSEDTDCLLYRARRALVSVKEIAVVELGHKLIWHHQKKSIKFDFFLYHHLFGYLANAKYSFLALRFLLQLKESPNRVIVSIDFKSEMILRLVLLLSAAPEVEDIIDWPTLDTMLEKFLGEPNFLDLLNYLWEPLNSRGNGLGLIGLVMRYAYRLPQSMLVIGKALEKEIGDFVPMRNSCVLSCYAIEAITGSTTPDILNLDVDELQHRYGDPRLCWLHEHVFRYSKTNMLLLFVMRGESRGIVIPKAGLSRIRVVNPERLQDLCRQMVQLTFSFHEKNELADRHAYLLTLTSFLDRYCHKAMDRELYRALTHPEANGDSVAAQILQAVFLVGMVPFIEIFSIKALHEVRMPYFIWRHTGKDGKIHLEEVKDECQRAKYSECTFCEGTNYRDEIEQLTIGMDDALWVEISADQIFNAKEHHPILAGINERGRKSYIARRPPFIFYDGDSAPHPMGLCTVKDGASYVKYYDRLNRLPTEPPEIHRKFHVLVRPWNPPAGEEETGKGKGKGRTREDAEEDPELFLPVSTAEFRWESQKALEEEMHRLLGGDPGDGGGWSAPSEDMNQLYELLASQFGLTPLSELPELGKPSDLYCPDFPASQELKSFEQKFKGRRWHGIIANPVDSALSIRPSDLAIADLESGFMDYETLPSTQMGLPIQKIHGIFIPSTYIG